MALTPKETLLNAEVLALRRQLDDAIASVTITTTEMKRVEMALFRSHELLREVQNIAFLGHYEFDIQDDRWESSTTLDEILGIGPHYLRNSESWLDLVCPDLRDEMRDYLRHILLHKLVFDREYRIIRHNDGRERWVHGLGQLHCDANGRPARLLGTIQDITARKELECDQLRIEERFRLAMEASNDGLWDWNLSDDSTYFNPAYYRMIGYEPNEFAMMGKNWVMLIHPEDRERALAANQECIDNLCEKFSVEFRMKAKDGSWRWILGRGQVFARDAQHRALRMVGTHVDITDRKLAENALRLASLVYNNSSEGMAITAPNGIINSVNPAFTKLTGYSESDAIGKNINILKSDRHEASFYKQMWNAVNTSGQWQGEIWNRHKNGDIRLEWLTINAVCNESGSVECWVAMYSDINEQKKLQETIWHQANFDSLTGLSNRRMFIERLEQEIKKANRVQLPLALMFIDLDKFKEVNDTLGHDKGDRLLQEAARRLLSCVRETDSIGRLGGDEFTLVMAELGDLNSVTQRAEAILRLMATPYHLDGNIVSISASIGITFYPADAIDADTLLKMADQAMYDSKRLGANCFSYCNSDDTDAPQRS